MRVQQTPPTEDEKMVSKDKSFELDFEKKKVYEFAKAEREKVFQAKKQVFKSKEWKNTGTPCITIQVEYCSDYLLHDH